LSTNHNDENAKTPTSVKWTDIKKELELEIISGKYSAGERIPSVADLAAKHGVSGVTAHKALESLCMDDIVSMRRGKGYYLKLYVIEPLTRRHIANVSGMLRDAVDYGNRLGLSEEEMKQLLAAAYQTHCQDTG